MYNLYIHIFKCNNCDTGHYGYTYSKKDNDLQINHYLCKNCILETKNGDEIIYFEGTEFIGDEYNETMKKITNVAEKKHFENLNTKFEYVAVDMILRDKYLLPVHKYLTFEEMYKINEDNLFDIMKHNLYIQNEGYEYALNRVRSKEFGICADCAVPLIPHGNHEPFIERLKIGCIKCNYIKDFIDLDSAYYGEWIKEEDFDDLLELNN